jgi:hypothetical protein
VGCPPVRRVDNVMSGYRAARCLNGVLGRDGGKESDFCAWCLGEEVEPACVKAGTRVIPEPRLPLTGPGIAVEGSSR